MVDTGSIFIRVLYQLSTSFGRNSVNFSRARKVKTVRFGSGDNLLKKYAGVGILYNKADSHSHTWRLLSIVNPAKNMELYPFGLVWLHVMGLLGNGPPRFYSN